ncbi:MAG: sarcosine oxidase subunit gamma family protein [Hyphomicrobiales bacterium]
MADTLTHRTPLSEVLRGSVPDSAVDIVEVKDRGMIDLRGHLADRDFGGLLGVDLPSVPRTSVSHGSLTVLWLSLDQWLITCPRGDAVALTAALQRDLQGVHSLVADVSDMRTILRVSGDGAAEVLMKGTSVDLTLADGKPGTVRRLRFAEVAAMVHALPDGKSFDLYVFRSYADYVLQYLTAAARPQAAIRLFKGSAHSA